MISTVQYIWKKDQWKSDDIISNNAADICFIFGSRMAIESYGKTAVASLTTLYPNAEIVTVSTAGNIMGTEVLYDTLTASCLSFEKTKIVVKSLVNNFTDTKALGRSIASSFDKKNLTSVLLYCTTGLNVGELLDGVNDEFDNKIKVSGGVAGDDTRFEKTLVGVGSDIREDNIVMVGLYSDNLKVTYGTEGGWETFGPPRKVTKASGNVLEEIDQIPVLDFYKEYLGPKAKDLPGSGLLFPFAIVDEETGGNIVRGIQDIDEKNKTITLFSDVKEGQTIHLMRANNNALIEGSGISAQKSMINQNKSPQVAILVSCVARKLALGQLLEDEVEEVRDILGEQTKICGFYSYSEISPLENAQACSLHNQTMTVTVFSEN